MTGGLNIRGAMGIESLALGSEQQHRIRAQWNTFPSIEQRMKEWGFEAMAKPLCTYPVITPDLLSGTDTRRYTEVYHQVSEWLAYGANMMSRLKAQLIGINNEMSVVELEIKKAAIQVAKDRGEKKPTAQALNDLYKSHPRWLELLREQQVVEQEKLILQSFVTTYENDSKRLSRQIELRKEDTRSRGTGHNMGYRGSDGYG